MKNPFKAWRESWSLRHIPRMGNRPYLRSVGREQSLEDARRDRQRGTWRARIHNFVGPDDAGHHNHPFAWSLSIVLSVLWGGSYTEEYLEDFGRLEGFDTTYERIQTRRVRFFNWIPNGKYHRITELRPGLFGVWTLFITGPRVTSWGFWVPGRGHVPHKQYHEEYDYGDDGQTE